MRYMIMIILKYMITINKFSSLDYFEIDEIDAFVDITLCIPLTLLKCCADYLAFTGNRPIGNARPQVGYIFFMC